MTERLAIVFGGDGIARTVYSETIDLSALGRLGIERATTVEFDNAAQMWTVTDADGVSVFRSRSRNRCLEWERRYLETREDMRHEAYA